MDKQERLYLIGFVFCAILFLWSKIVKAILNTTPEEEFIDFMEQLNYNNNAESKEASS